MKLDTLRDGHQRQCREQELNSVTSNYLVTSRIMFCNNKHVRSISLKIFTLPLT